MLRIADDLAPCEMQDAPTSRTKVSIALVSDFNLGFRSLMKFMAIKFNRDLWEAFSTPNIHRLKHEIQAIVATIHGHRVLCFRDDIKPAAPERRALTTSWRRVCPFGNDFPNRSASTSASVGILSAMVP